MSGTGVVFTLPLQKKFQTPRVFSKFPIEPDLLPRLVFRTLPEREELPADQAPRQERARLRGLWNRKRLHQGNLLGNPWVCRDVPTRFHRMVVVRHCVAVHPLPFSPFPRVPPLVFFFICLNSFSAGNLALGRADRGRWPHLCADGHRGSQQHGTGGQL